MLGTLSLNQSIQLLQSETIGRLGCCENGKVYIIPIAYAFDGKHIYAHSREGMKIQFMRKNPNVCIEVDRIENMINWRSVVVQGKFEELKTKTAIAHASQLLSERLEPIVHSQAIKPIALTKDANTIIRGLRAIYYKIKVIEISGRYEKSELVRH
jgi:nitroimidazol reductase NimA-like FMN-containing flavoprotein (pyridoxamine 5'-phosphate oxidase superfamily)